ncbi:MAG: hypothetical protein ACRC1P_05765 [Cellulosilyticaceae bacterium]
MANKPGNKYRYQYGSAAYKYNTQAYPASHEEQEQSQSLSRKYIQKQKKENFLFNLKMGICGVVLFGAAISFVYVSAQLSIKQNELKAINTQLRDTKSAINSIQSTIASTLNLEYIQYMAATQLNMSEPLPHQVVYIELPKENHTVYNE